MFLSSLNGAPQPEIPGTDMGEKSSPLPAFGQLSQTSTVGSGPRRGSQPFHCSFVTVRTKREGKYLFLLPYLTLSWGSGTTNGLTREKHKNLFNVSFRQQGFIIKQ